MTKEYDIVVIGGGPAGTAVAGGLKAQGKSVLIVEADLWGGTCPNRGCDPKKILLSAVEAQQRAKNLQGHGLTGVPTVDWPALMTTKRGYTDGINDGTLSGLQGQKIATLHGQATFNADGTLQVGDETVSGTDYVIATGQRPTILPVEGQEYFKTSTDFLDLDTMPKRVTFVGGGYVGFELATIARAAGAEVHLIHHNDRPLKAFDTEHVQALMGQLTEQGITFDLNVDLQRITKQPDGLHLTAADGFDLTTDLVICSAGRQPNVDHLGLANVGVTVNRGGVQVNDHLQTANPHIYAIGDVSDTPVPKLTPVAGYEARYLVGELTQPAAAITYPVIPTEVYAEPKLAEVGITTAKASEDSARYQVNTLDMTHWFTYYRLQTPKALAKVVVDRQSGLVVGASFLSEIADEMINYVMTLIQQKVTLAELQKLIWAYPTPASDLQYLV
ncbi:dihydrolipoyl dehydrogenase family protein [Lactiplantibacillus mudanjiangensis]|uniref:NAD(P)/FAD-dependent oxidoreductase [Lactobacillus sp.] n=1 Tax=Lactiplantibacillus mudanjiangensis TaxID=1296538 RepID=A0A660E0A4_9LACO|nr:NAD(P)/FAD-dependent oxidoreductase [Lactiplantibacillus mudanjiangensis]VDG26049.1 NAD(P)/FAD-dependent oxidoreductase [Lactobacillus sp.] [Lactiplantibacillus mudanjiangensis]VDG29113.1 NAD(P)/FAD-dependent oxidoreductase [Lactobacillus sp.] [Lactiplantibacillus mudanjiangensis]